MSMNSKTSHSPEIAQQLAGLSPAKRALLEMKLMKKKPGGRTTRQVIERQANRDSAPLSYNQQGLWVLNQLMPGTSLYHTPTAARLNGKLHVAGLRRALNAIVARHDVLRTRFATIEGAPTQVIAPNMSLEVPLMDLSHLPAAEREEEALRILRLETQRSFDLSAGPLIRALLLRLQEQEHILLVTAHHIVTDGWSVGLFHQELSALYEAFSQGKSSPLAELPIQYSDFAHWQRQWLGSEMCESQLAYWKKQFATLPPVLELPTDHQRPNVQAYRAFRGSQHTIGLPPQLTRELKLFCQQNGVTLFMTLLTAYQILLHRYTGEEDIVVGSPIAGRQMAETENLIGLFINTLAMRTNLSGNPSFLELLERVKETALGAYANQDLPFEQLVKELQPERTLAHNPLFQVIFVLQSEEISALKLPGLTATHFRVGNIMADFDLILDVVERDEQLICLFESNADLFESETIERMMGHFQTMLEGIVRNPQQRVSELPLVTDGERRQLLVDWNQTGTDYPANKCVHELFEEQVARTPDAVAIVFEDQQLTYAEVNRQANQVANYLRTLGVGPETLVGVRMERSARLIVALLGIVKAGAAYLPLDLAYPKDRIAFMLSDAQAPVVLTEARLAKDLPESNARVVSLDANWNEIAKQSPENPAKRGTSDNLVYVIYTSGSTGVPKGVSVTHKAINRLVFNTNYVELSATDRVAQASNSSFDAATFEIWGALLHGARLVGITKDVALSPKQFAAEIRAQKISVMFLTTALFNQIARDVPDAFGSMRQLMFGGEAVDPHWVREVLKHGPPERLLHVYGPTECTTFASWFLIKSVPEGANTVPIGRPISNTETYIVDRYFNPTPVGVPGELYLGGDGLAREYLNRPELTSERFVANPFSEDKGARLYKTGDVVRYLPDGNIEFVGRVDHQVKVRGFRIELGEIETALLEHPAISEAVVSVSDERGDKRLVAYFVPAKDTVVTPEELREFLKRKLADYMLPSVYVALSALPLSPNGKIDRRALAGTTGVKLEFKANFVAPNDEFELKLAKIWEKVLGVRQVGCDDNFFELGGHSLLAVRLFAQIESAFGRNLPLATLFQAPTVRQLARVLREEGWPGWSSLVSIQKGGNRAPFFCVHAAGGNVLEYNDLARLLGPEQPFYGLQAKGLDGKEEPLTTIKEMAAHYLKEMREVQPEGPYLIGGRSSGGTVAFEMACQLADVGQEVALLALLDTYPAGYFKLLPGASSRRERTWRRLKKWGSHVDNLRKLNAAESVAYIFRKLRFAPAKIKHKIYRRAYKFYKRYGRAIPQLLKNIEEINFAAVKEYVPRTYAGDLTLFLAKDMTADYDLHEGWRNLVHGEIETYEISGNHLDMIKQPHVNELAERLSACLRRAQEDSLATEEAA
jgi:amino acid adenylation domain-containing protein